MLKRLPLEQLISGMRAPGGIYDGLGVCVIEAGTELTKADLDTLSALGADRLFTGDDWPRDLTTTPLTGLPLDGPPTESPHTVYNQGGSRERTISIEQFREEIYSSVLGGMSLPQDIYDENGVLLLAAGARITPQFLQLLKDRGIQSVHLRRPGKHEPPARSTRIVVAEPALPRKPTEQVTAKLDAQLAGELSRQPPLRPVKAWRRPRLPIETFKTEATAGLERHAATSNIVSGFCSQLDESVQRGIRLSGAEIKTSVNKFAELAAQDFDLLPFILSMQNSGDDYLFDHCVNVAMLSVTLAHQLGLPHQHIVEIGLGALLQDMGMLRVPASIRTSSQRIVGAERLEIERHPLHTLELLEGIRGLPQAVKMIVYQSHERMDGTGYPQRRSGVQIHQFARIVGIADAYASRTRPRPHRPAMSPYEALKEILVESSQKKFDSTIVRALLDTVSLFPIGSRVELNSGQQATVLRANPDQHTSPILEALDPYGSSTGQIIDLSHESELWVVRALGNDEPVSAV